MKEGYDVRISGQDRAWNFFHRHAVVSEDSEEEVILINNLEGKKGKLIFITLFYLNMEF
jgi:2-oxoglutarate dehydrogenase E1 component